MRQRLEAVDWLEAKCAQPVLIEDGCRAWLADTLAGRLESAGVATVGELVDRINSLCRLEPHGRWNRNRQGARDRGIPAGPRRPSSWLYVRDTGIGAMRVAPTRRECEQGSGSPLVTRPLGGRVLICLNRFHAIAISGIRRKDLRHCQLLSLQRDPCTRSSVPYMCL